MIATTSTANRDFVASLGADHVIDYTKEDVTRAVESVDLVLDTVGGAVLKQSLPLVRKGGQLLSIVAPPDEAAAKERGVEARFVRSNLTGIKLEEIGGLIDAGKVKLVVEREFPLAEARAAHKLIETGHVRGKIILRVV